jgi:transcriptional regulator with XRE-family HTH domain
MCTMPNDASMPDESGAASLRWLRRISGLTQDSLAVRSGVSERTIRGMERGTVSVPHDSTLRLLAEAADLDEQQTEAFLGSWNQHRYRLTFDEVFGADIEQAIRGAHARSAVETVVITKWCHDVVDANRRRVRAEHECTIEAQRDGVEGVPFVLISDDSEDLRLMELTPTFGCSTSGRISTSRTDVFACDLRFPRPLMRGETLTYSYRLDLRSPRHVDSGPDTRDRAQDSSGTWSAVLAPVPYLIVEASFLGERPVSAYLQDGGPADSPATHGASFPPTGATLQRIEQNAAPGRYGFRWDWARPAGASEPPPSIQQQLSPGS